MKEQNWKYKFFTIWAGQAISLITSSILQMAIILYLTEKTNSALVLAMATLVGFVPQAVLGLFIGVWVDRLNRKLIMIGADLFIAAIGGCLAVIAIFMEPPIWAVLAVLFLRSVGTAFHTPAISAVTPLLVPEDRLAKCAGYSQAIQSVGYIISPMLGALLYVNWSIAAIVAIDIIGALIACVAVAVIHIPSIKKEAIAKEKSFIAEIKEGYDIIRNDKGLKALMIIGALYMFAYMPINALFPLMSMDYFHGTATHVAITEVIFAAGMLIGGTVLGVWGGFKKKTRTILASMLIMGFSLVISGVIPSTAYTIFVVACFLMGMSAPFYGVQTAIFQEKVKPEYLGRIFAFSMSIMSFAMPVGLIFAGLFANRIGTNHWFFMTGVFVLTLAIVSMGLKSVNTLDESEQNDSKEEKTTPICK